MSGHDTKLPEGLVTSDAVRSAKRPRARRWLVIAGAAVAVVGLVGIGAKLYLFRKAAISSPQTAQSSAIQKANEAVIHPQAGVDGAQAALQGAHTTQDKAAAYMNLGAAYLNTRQGKEAIAAYQSALALDSGLQVPAESGLGYAYALDGQKDQAINAFQKVIDAVRTIKDPSVPSEIAIYQSAIDQLQAGQSII